MPTPTITAPALVIDLEAISLEALDLANMALDYARAVPADYPGTNDLRLTSHELRDRIDREHPRTYRTDLTPAQPYAVLDLFREAAQMAQRARTHHAAWRNDPRA